MDEVVGYAKDDRLTAIAYTGVVNPTSNVGFTWDPYFPRLVSRTDGAGTTQFTYVPVGSLGALQVQQQAGPFANSAITSAYRRPCAVRCAFLWMSIRRVLQGGVQISASSDRTEMTTY